MACAILAPIAPHYDRELARLNKMADKLDDLFADDQLDGPGGYYEFRDEVYDHIDRLACTYGVEAAEDLAREIDFPWESGW